MKPSPVDGKRDSHSLQAAGGVLTATVVAMSVAALGCGGQDGQPPGELTPQEEGALADTVESLTEEVTAAFEELSPASFFKFFSADYVFYYRGAPVHREQWEKQTRDFMRSLQTMSVEVVERDVEVLGRDAAVVSQQEVARADDATGDTLAETFVWERRGGEWKIVQSHESFEPREDGS